MFIRTTKVLLALGLMTAAGSSGALYIVSGGGHQLLQDGYCGQVWFTDQTGRGVMSNTISDCQVQLAGELAAATRPVSAVEACHLCRQKFGTVPVTGYVLPPQVANQFLEGTQALRDQFRIDDYERAQQEFERSLVIEPGH